MKLPFNIVFTPLLRPYLNTTKTFCQHPTFALRIPYTYFYGALGLIFNAHHLRSNLGELPYHGELTTLSNPLSVSSIRQLMLVHDLKIIATSMGLVQYFCLMMGCLTENPALFLPHLVGQIIFVLLKILNLFLLITQMNIKSIGKFTHKLFAVALMTFNCMQEFCVFRQHLCICDL
ncbi:uncharacterized protein [Epargyreus clarus]|uniref:uncharacterized protein n=1 Tax=Epargyreus clarus TaxID=520877 RepID=UPI003C2E6C2C